MDEIDTCISQQGLLPGLGSKSKAEQRPGDSLSFETGFLMCFYLRSAIWGS